MSDLSVHVRWDGPEDCLSALVVVEDLADEAGYMQRVGLVLAVDIRKRRWWIDGWSRSLSLADLQTKAATFFWSATTWRLLLRLTVKKLT